MDEQTHSPLRTKMVRALVRAAYEDAQKTWPSLTLDWLETEAANQLRGARPTGGPGVFLNDCLKKAGLLD